MKKKPVKQSTLSALRQQVAQLQQEKDAVYRERNLCVAAMVHAFKKAGTYPMGYKEHIGSPFEDCWNNVVFIKLPTGQVSWHLHDHELANFMDIGYFSGEWDGHTTEEKYNRVKRFIQTC